MLTQLAFVCLILCRRAQKAEVPIDYVLGVGGFDLEKVEDDVSALGDCKWIGRAACSAMQQNQTWSTPLRSCIPTQG